MPLVTLQGNAQPQNDDTGSKRTDRKREEKKRPDYAFWRQFNEKPSIIPGCPD